MGGSGTGHPVQPGWEIAQTYEAGGRPVKRLETRRTEELVGEGPQTNITETVTTTYYLYSSVLGATVMELDAAGVKTTGYVYANGGELAKQVINPWGSIIWWHHANAGTNSWVEVSDGVVERREMDPMGADVGVADPYVNLAQPLYKDLHQLPKQLYLEGGDPFDFSDGHTRDGVPISGSELRQLNGNGMPGSGWTLSLDVFHVPERLRDRSREHWVNPEYLHRTISLSLQWDFRLISAGQTQNPGPQDPRAVVDASIGEAEKLLSKQNCWDFVHNKLGVNNPDGIPDWIRRAQLVTHPNDYSSRGRTTRAVATYPNNLKIDFYRPFFIEGRPQETPPNTIRLGPAPMEDRARDPKAQGQDTLHEGIHLWLGKGDIEIANLFLKPGQDPFTDEAKASKFWHDKLKEKCDGRGKNRIVR